MHKKSYAFAEVKAAADSENPNGEFEVILSAETLDRDGEVIDAKAFDPLPESIPFHAFHDFHDPIGRAVPFYDGGVLKARGVFASTPRAQEIRTLVSEGVIGHTSVGFMAATRVEGEDAPHITKGELLEGSFVSVPSNREAAVLAAKEFDLKASENTAQAIHDLAVQHGAVCDEDNVADDDGNTDPEATPAPETPADEPASREAPAPVAGKSPASEVVDRPVAARVEAFLLSVED